MDAAKIRLSAEELVLVQNAHWLLTKNNIIEKVVAAFGRLSEQMKAGISQAAASLPAEVGSSSPKISKGEKYEGLPWVMLDYPRVFGRDDTWAIRTFFWWGHFFSITLQLKGNYKQQCQAALLQHLDLLKQYDFYICIAAGEWEHHFGEENYTPLRQLEDQTITALLSGSQFCKISTKIGLHEWDQANEMLADLYRVLLQAAGY
jgi:hypothetical protein